MLDDALALWRGPALLEFAHLDFAWGFAAKLEERKLVATEDRIDADRRLGRHASVVGELGELVAAHPLREQLRHHLALALYRSGRQAEALRLLDDARRTLRNQLGIDPGRPLVDLEPAILNQDPDLELAGNTSKATHPAAAGAGADRGGASAGSHAGTVRLRRRPPPATPAGAPGPRLVGRDVELRQVMLALDEARTATRVVLIEGEPGIGKTRLVEEAATAAAAHGAAVLWGRAFEGGAAPAFWPWLPPLRSLVGRLDRDTELAPQLASLAVATAGGDAAGADAALVTDRTRFELFDAVTGLIAQSADDQQLMLVLDDLQWADPASLQLLTFVAGQLVDRPVLLVCTVRELEVGRNDGVVEALAALSRAPGTRRIFLRGLSDTATAELVEVRPAIRSTPTWPPRSRSARTATPSSPPSWPGSWWRSEQGRRRGAVPPGGDVPSGVRDVVRRRIALLPEGTIAMLQVAAVIGRDVELDLLTAAPAGPSTRCSTPSSRRSSTGCWPRARTAGNVPLLARPGARGGGRRRVGAAPRPHPPERGRRPGVDRGRPRRRGRDHCRAPVGRGRHRCRSTGGRGAGAGGDRGGAALRGSRRLRACSNGLSSSDAAAGPRRPTSRRRWLPPAGCCRSSGRSTAMPASPIRPTCGGRRSWRRQADRADIHGPTAVGRVGRLRLHVRLRPVRRHRPGAPPAGQRGDEPLARITGLASLGISRWHRGHVGEASALLDDACQAAADAAVPTATLGLDLEVVLLPYPFARYLHVLTGDLDEVAGEAEFEELAAAAPDRYAVSLVQMFASAGAGHRPAGMGRTGGSPGHRGRPRGDVQLRGPEGYGYLAAALIQQGTGRGGPVDDRRGDRPLHRGRRADRRRRRDGVPGHRPGSGRRTAPAWPAAAYKELETYGERFAEPLVLEADACARMAAATTGRGCCRPPERWRWPPRRARTASPGGSTPPPSTWGSTARE